MRLTVILRTGAEHPDDMHVIGQKVERAITAGWLDAIHPVRFLARDGRFGMPDGWCWVVDCEPEGHASVADILHRLEAVRAKYPGLVLETSFGQLST
jgi:hypothetical protein